MGEGVCDFPVLALCKYIQFFQILDFLTEDDVNNVL